MSHEVSHSAESSSPGKSPEVLKVVKKGVDVKDIMTDEHAVGGVTKSLANLALALLGSETVDPFVGGQAGGAKSGDTGGDHKHH